MGTLLSEAWLRHRGIGATMVDDFLARGLQNPSSIPDCHEVKLIFWDCFRRAEHAFGPREPGWEYTVKLRESPQYPETTNDAHSRVTVWLTTKRSWVGYYFEAAHEVVHCLNPIVPSGAAMRIEEAIAVEFSLKVIPRIFGQYRADLCDITPEYRRARELASKIDTDVIRLGQRLRCTLVR